MLIHVFMEKLLIHEMNIHLFMSENRDFGYPCVMYGIEAQNDRLDVNFHVVLFNNLQIREKLPEIGF